MDYILWFSCLSTKSSQLLLILFSYQWPIILFPSPTQNYILPKMGTPPNSFFFFFLILHKREIKFKIIIYFSPFLPFFSSSLHSLKLCTFKEVLSGLFALCFAFFSSYNQTFKNHVWHRFYFFFLKKKKLFDCNTIDIKFKDIIKSFIYPH